MSQIIRATFVSPSFHGIRWKVSGSGIAIMSDSSIALKPVIDEPSKPIPSSSAFSTSLGVIAKLLRWPSMSENHRSTNSTPSFSIRARTCLRDCSLEVALFFVSTCAMRSSLEMRKASGAGEDVIVLDKFTYAGNAHNLPSDVDCRRGDIATREDVDQVGPVDAIVNFAAETHVDPGWSSREDDPLRPSSPYSASKAGGDLQVLAAVRTFGVNASITRGSNTYGPNQYPEKVLPLFATNALDGEPLPLYGDGRQVRDWLHVDDHCAAIELVLRQGEAGEVYNVGANEEHENVELTKLIVEHLGVDPLLVRNVEDRAGHDRRYSLETAKVRSLGWQPRRDWADGVRATIDWYHDNRDWWEPIKRSSGFREYYDKQYAARLGS